MFRSVATGYLYRTAKNKYLSLFTAIPAIFMTAVVTTYILAEPELALGRFIPYYIALIIGVALTIAISGFYIFKLLTKKNIEESH